ncbi:VOC family protein [Spongiactinospora sp. TRM90649]|uniref:VOC family protein n=1 Tax=Spongiactinospora sp. TRM90649 TaxID=3031114 RepID=UPI0023F7C5CE|nr:VOC family protein [Spongiactinospora sp. TRM90649]MDF5755298.1 VOC family protein [Spongiactinospora sp. TRM90649]
MSTRLVNLIVDAAEPRRLAAFWADLLGWPIALATPEEVRVRAPEDDGWDLGLRFVLTTAPRNGGNRVRLALTGPTPERMADRIARALRLGGRRDDPGRDDAAWEALADPEGNGFRVLAPGPLYNHCGAIAAILIDAADQDRLAAFWAEATGRVRARVPMAWPALRAASGTGPWLEFPPASAAGPGGNRLRLDVAPPTGGDHDLAAERLIGLGARRIGGGGDLPWHVLADPEGNEFRVLAPRPRS